MTTTPDLGRDLDEGLGTPRARRAEPPSLRPALVVLACAVVLSFGGFAVALIGGGQAAPSIVTGLGTPVPGVNLSAVGASQVLRRISNGGTPPRDVLEALVVPNGARIVSTTAQDAELLAQRTGSDGYEWEVGVVVTPVNPAISPSLAGDGQTSAVMGLRLRLFVVPDSGS